MEQSKIDRINELYRKSKAEELLEILMENKFYVPEDRVFSEEQ